jgi:polar amino acid transport system substrate-binding protein
MEPQHPMRIHPAVKAAQRGRVLAGLLAGAVCVVAATTAWWVFHDRSLARLRGGEPLRVGYAVEAPYAFITPAGRVTGESPETARKVAERLGLGEPEWVLTDFGSLIGQLKAGRFDVIAAGLFITEERKRDVVFSRETARVSPGLLVAKGNPHGLSTYRQAVGNKQVKLAALDGSVECSALAASGMPAARLVIVPDANAGLALLLAGKVDGFALSRPTVNWMAAREENLGRLEAVAEPALTDHGDEGRVAFAFRKEDRRLRQAWDRALADVLSGDEHRAMLRELGFGEGEGVK